MSKILIKNGKIWDGEKFYFSDILIENETISKIADNIEETAEFEYDARGKIVSAGLVDAHVHMRGLNEVYGIHAEMSCIPFGVTAAADACGVLGDKALLDSFLLKNVVFVPVQFENNKAFFDMAENGIKRYGERAIGVKVCFDEEISEVTDISPLFEVIDFAEKHGLILMVHSSNSPVPMKELFSVLRKGDIVTHAYHGGKNNISDDGFACIEDAKRRGIIIDVGYAGFVHTDFKVLGDAIKSGAYPDTISTDITWCSAYKRGGRYGMTMCMSIASHLGMNEEDIFRAVTSTPAKALGKESEWGYLQVGRRADIAVLDYTNEGFDLTDKAGNRVVSETGYRCVLTLADGEVVYRL